MTKTLEQQLRSTRRAIIIFRGSRGWGVTDIEGSDWDAFDWKSSLPAAWKSYFGDIIELSDQEERTIKEIESGAKFTKQDDKDDGFSDHEWWPENKQSVNGWLRGGLL